MRSVIVFISLLAGAARAETLAISGATMGTTYHVKVADAPADLRPEGLKADVEKVLAEFDLQMSTWRADSEVSQFNRAPAGKWFAVSVATAKVVAMAQSISRKTDGALDVTVGPLVRLWHFGPGEKSNVAATSNFVPPSKEVIERARKVVGYQNLEFQINIRALRKSVDGLEIDLSSIASGYAIDELARLLVARGAKNWLVEIGGEVRAAGNREDDNPWQVAIERPIPGKPQLQLILPLLDASIATAGDYKKFFEYDGRRYSHVIDPSTGRPVEHTLGSVTVVATSCVMADGWDTALLVMGPERGFECAEKNGVAALFISRENERNVVRATPAWEARFGSAAASDR